MESQSRRGSVLVIEDDHTLIALFETILRQAGFQFRSATSADAAQKLMDQHRFDVLVCDLSVAGGTKVFELIKTVRKQHPEIAVLIVTGYTPEEIASEIASQDVELLEKPFSPPELVKRVAALAKRRAA
jgi:DNA-binding NtrC family response regulator